MAEKPLSDAAIDTWMAIVNDLTFYGQDVPPAGPYVLVRDLVAWPTAKEQPVAATSREEPSRT